MRSTQGIGSSTFWPPWQRSANTFIGGVGVVYITLLLGCSGGGAGGDSNEGGPEESIAVPTGDFEAVATYSSGLWLTQVAVADLNGDGRKDVVSVTDWSFGQYVAIFYQGTTGDLAVLDTIDAYTTYNFGHLQRIAVGDLNNDGRDDLLLTGQCNFCAGGYQFVVLYQHPATGNLLPGVTFFAAAGNIAIADINSDGRNDLITNNAAGQLSIFYQLTNGHLGAEVVYGKVSGFIRGEIHVADMDNDGDNDIVIQNGLKQLAVVKQDSTVVPGTLVDIPEYYDVQTTYWPQFEAFTVGDLNGDGKNDVVVVDPGNSGTMNVFLQNNDGKLDSPILTVPWFAPPDGVEIADINGDGLNDILGNQGGSVYILYQTLGHMFHDPIVYSAPTISYGGSIEHQGLAVADITGDGKPDAVMTWHDEGLFVFIHTIS